MIQRILLRLYVMILVASAFYWLACNGLYWLAAYNVDKKDNPSALHCYQILSRIAPGYPDVFICQAWREFEMEHYAEARKLAELGQRGNPKSPEVANLFGQLAYHEGKFEEALQFWKDNPAGQAYAYYELGRLEECRASLAKCAPDEPGLDELRKALQEQEGP